MLLNYILSSPQLTPSLLAQDLDELVSICLAPGLQQIILHRFKHGCVFFEGFT